MSQYENPDEEYLWEEDFGLPTDEWLDPCEENDEEDDENLFEEPELSRSELLAYALTEAIQDTFGKRKKGNSHPDCSIPSSVQHADHPSCAEAMLRFKDHLTCIHICDLPYGSCRLTIVFFGKHPKKQKLLELIDLWPQQSIADCLMIDPEDCTDNTLVLSGILKPGWCDTPQVLQMALENIFVYFTNSKTNQLLLAMLRCFDPV